MIYKIIKLLVYLLILNNEISEIYCQRRSRKGSLVIAFDNTGSMQDDLDQLREASIKITNKFDTLPHYPIENFILVEFNDPYVNEAIITANKSVLFQHLNNIRVDGGGDCPEQCYEGMEKGLLVANYKSYMFVFTDASSKKPEKIPIIKKIVQKKQIPIYFFVANSCDTDINHQQYRDIAEASNGLFFDVARKEIDDILKNFGDFIDEKRSIVDTFKSDTGAKTEKVLKVDEGTKEFTLTFIGTKPLIKILDPKNHEYKNYKTLTSLDNVKMLQVKNPVPGAWKIDMSASSAYSGQISVLSDMIFKYGFSLEPPRSIYNTAYQPLFRQRNYLSISPMNNTLISKLDSVSLLFGGGKLDLKLKKIETGPNEVIYSTELFTLPNKAFKINLHGYDRSNNEIARLLSPEISGTSASIPEIGDSHELITVQEGEPIHLLCEVISLEPVEIKWRKENKIEILKQFEAKQSEMLNYTIQFAEKEHIGKYICTAKNSLGTTELHTYVDVRSSPLLAYTPTKNYDVPEYSPMAILTCKVSPKTKRTVHWLFKNSPTLPNGAYMNGDNLIIPNPTRETAGDYTCVAKKIGLESSSKVALNILYPAQIDKITENGKEIESSKPIDLFNEDNVRLTCESSGNPEPNVQWVLGNGVISRSKELDIKRSDAQNMKQYTCISSNGQGSEMKKSIIFKTIYPPTKHSTFVDFYSANINEKFTLDCPVDDNNNVTWTLNNEKLESRFIRNNQLVLDPIMYNMQGTYKCVASNKAGSTEATVIIDVLHPPNKVSAESINIPKYFSSDLPRHKNHLSLNVGDNVVGLVCTSNGNPETKIKWYFRNRPITTGNTIDINSANSANMGMYKCVAENDLGTKTLSIYIHVSRPTLLSTGFKESVIKMREDGDTKFMKLLDTIELPDDYFNADYLKHITLNEGESIDLECEMSGRSTPTWYKNNIQIPHTTDKFLLKDVKIEDNGIYRCKQTYTEGETNVLYYVNILKTPSILVFDMPIPFEVSESKNLVLPCKVTGNYLPIIEWLHPNGSLLVTNQEVLTRSNSYTKNRLLMKNEKIYINLRGEIMNNRDLSSSNEYGVLTYDNSILTLFYVKNKVSNVDAVSYKCIIRDIENRRPIQTTEAPVNVLTPPWIEHPKIKSEQSFEVLPNVSFNLYCPLQGKPKPSITWTSTVIPDLKSDNLFAETQKQGIPVLEFKSPNLGQTGVYKCVGENSQGRTEIIFNIHVVENSNNLIDPEYLNEDIIEHIEIERGAHKQVQCPFKDKSDVFWEEVGRTRNYLSERFYSISSDHDHELLCSSDRKPNSKGKKFVIKIFDPPRLETIRDTKISRFTDEEFNIACNIISGYPKPTITWIKKNSTTDNTLHSDSNIDIDDNKLTIHNVQISDEGIYKCRATNIVGDDEMFVTLNVKERFEWLPWDDWSPCSETCGTGSQSRQRACKQVDNSDVECTRTDVEHRECTIKKCPIDGGWGEFSGWGPCSQTCVNEKSSGSPAQIRRRFCNSPSPQYGGQSCIGSATEKRDCTPPPCPINGKWSNFEQKVPCSATCGRGFIVLERQYIPAKYGGKDIPKAEGTQTRRTACNVRPCCKPGSEYNARRNACQVI